MAVPFPLNVRNFFEMMLSSHGDMEFIPNLLEKLFLDYDETSKEVLNTRFK